MKDSITPDFSDQHKAKNHNIEDFVIEYKSGCAECTPESDVTTTTSRSVDAESLENKLFICLCNEIKHLD